MDVTMGHQKMGHFIIANTVLLVGSDLQASLRSSQIFPGLRGICLCTGSCNAAGTLMGWM